MRFLEDICKKGIDFSVSFFRKCRKAKFFARVSDFFKFFTLSILFGATQKNKPGNMYLRELFIFPPLVARNKSFLSILNIRGFWPYNERKMFYHFIVPNFEIDHTSSFILAMTMHYFISTILLTRIFMNEKVFCMHNVPTSILQ